MEAQQKQTSKGMWGILAYIILSIGVFAAILIIPATREIFKDLSNDHPYLMGFVKFALLATAGELLAVRLGSGKWKLPPRILFRFVIWGLIGIWITYMMKIFGIAVGAMMQSGLLPGGKISNEILYRLLNAFFISVTMNTAFGPTFMAVHKCTDKYLELTAAKETHGLKEVITGIDWHRFVSFTIFKTVPIFWIPAHTVTFLLPAEYQVIMAASLSVALGIILNLKKK